MHDFRIFRPTLEQPTSDARMRGHVRRGWTLIALVALVGFSATNATAGPQLGAGVGVFEPWDGNSGYAIQASLLAPIGETERWRIGGQLSYREYETQIFDVDDIDAQSIRLSFVTHVKLLVDTVIQPYLGAQISIGVNIIDGDAVLASNPRLTDVNDVGTGIGVAGVAGVEVPLGDRFAFYGEAAAGADFQITQTTELSTGQDETEIENIGGISVSAGVRVRF